MISYAGKKLLVLGDNPESAVIVDTANKLGIKTIVTGINKGSITKRIGWKAVDVNGLDIDAMEKLAREEQVDGIMVGVADVLVPAYTELCKRLELPCYSTETAVKYLASKTLFKKALAKYGLPVIPEYQETEAFRNGDYSSIPYPVVSKPVDCGGGLGISIVRNAEDLKAAVDKAYENSHSRQIQVEKYMSGDIVACYYTIIDGEVFLSSMEDNIFTDKQGDLCPVTTGHYYCSKYIDLYFEKYHEKMCSLLRGVEVRNGILQINAFVENDELYFYDPGFRFQGEAQHHILNAVNHFDHKEMMVKFAFSGRMYEGGNFADVNDPRLHGKACASVWVLLKAGTVGSIEGIKEIAEDPSCVFNGQRFFEGMEVTKPMAGTEKQVFSRIYLVCENRDELTAKIRNIRETLSVKSSDGEEMILDILA